MFTFTYASRPGTFLLLVMTLGCTPDIQPPPPADTKFVAPRQPEPSTKAKEPSIVRIESGDGSWLGATPLPMDAWYALYLGGREIGYSHVQVTTSSASGTNLLRLSKEDVFELTSEGTTTRREVKLESLERSDGQFRHYTETSRTGNSQNTINAALNGDQLKITSQSGSNVEGPSNLPWRPGAWGPLGTIAILRKQSGKTEPFQAEMFVPQLGTFAIVQFTPHPPQSTTLLGGTVAELTPIDVLMKTDNSTAYTKNWVHPSGEIAKSVSDGNFLMFQIDQAKAAMIDAELRVAELLDRKLQIEAPNASAESSKVTYEIDREELADDSLYSLISRKVNQQVKSQSSLSVLVTVWNPNGNLPDTIEQDPPSEACSTPIDPDSPLIQQLSKIPGADADSRTAMQQLTLGLHRNLVKEPLSRKFERAKAVAARRAGDCKGHATLLVAVLRARGIPARVASGLLLSESTANFHMWCEGWDGQKWISLDPWLGSTAIGVNHIKFIESLPDIDNPYQLILPVLRAMQGMSIRIKPVD